jgi:hypothetical protein
MPINIGATSATGQVIGGNECAREGLVMWLDAGDVRSADQSGTGWNDMSGHDNDMTGNNVEAADLASGYWSPDGTNEYWSNTGFLDPTDDDDFSVECWLQLGSTNELGGIIVQGKQGNSWGICRSTSATVNFAVRGDTNRQASSGTLTASTWYHIAGTYNDSHVTKIYVDGAEAASVDGDPGTVSTTENFYIGYKDSTSGSSASMKYFDGILGIVRVYNRTLSASEVLYNFHSERSRYGK